MKETLLAPTCWRTCLALSSNGAIRSIDQAYRTTRVEFRQLGGTFAGWKRLGLTEDPRRCAPRVNHRGSCRGIDDHHHRRAGGEIVADRLHRVAIAHERRGAGLRGK